jgi:hypothetical protein
VQVYRGKNYVPRDRLRIVIRSTWKKFNAKQLADYWFEHALRNVTGDYKLQNVRKTIESMKKANKPLTVTIRGGGPALHPFAPCRERRSWRRRYSQADPSGPLRQKDLETPPGRCGRKPGSVVSDRSVPRPAARLELGQEHAFIVCIRLRRAARYPCRKGSVARQGLQSGQFPGDSKGNAAMGRTSELGGWISLRSASRPGAFARRIAIRLSRN